MKAQEFKKYEAYNYYRKSAQDFIKWESDREKAKRLLEEVKDAISQLEELGPNYAVWQNAQASHKILKKANKDLRFVG
jgi:DNA repair exonuclease SbcCD ATPase subunit